MPAATAARGGPVAAAAAQVAMCAAVLLAGAGGGTRFAAGRWVSAHSRTSRAPQVALVAAAAACIAAGFLRYAAWERACSGNTAGLFDRDYSVVEGVVIEEPTVSSGGLRFKMAIERAGASAARAVAARGLLLVRLAPGDWEGLPPPVYGDAVSVCGTARRPRGRSNPGGFDYAPYLRSQGVHVELLAGPGGVDVIDSGRGSPLMRVASRLRARMEAAADAGLPPVQASLLKGIVLGSRSSMPDEVEEDFRHAGVYHILSVSGLHVQFVLRSLTTLLGRLRVPKRASTAFALLALPFYGLLTGMRPPVLRAVIMAVPPNVAPYLQRRPDPPTSLALAAIAVVGWWPGSVLDPGFHLSFGATVGLMVFSTRVQAALGFLPTGLASALSVTVAAQLTVFPVVAREFQEISLVSLAVNPLVVPLTGYATGLGLAGMIAGCLVTPFGTLVNLPNRLILYLAMTITSLAAGMPGAFWYVCPPRAATSLTYYAVLFLLWRAFPPETIACRCGRTRLAAAVIASALALSLVHAAETAPPRGLELVFLDVGQGDAIVIRCPGGGVTLVDAGGPARAGRPSAGEKVVLPALRWLGVRRLNAAMITHLHDDHYGGMPAVLERLECPRVIVPPHRAEQAVRAGIPQRLIAEAAAGYSWVDGGVLFEVLHPPAASSDPGGSGTTGADAAGQDAGGEAEEDVPENDRSIVLRMTYGATRVLLTGDVGAGVERSLIDGGDNLGAGVLKVGHHGSNGSSSAEFLAAVGPRYAVVQVGPNNHGLPGTRAISRLRATGAAVLRTDHRGAVTVFTNGRDVSVSCFLNSCAASCD